jgi:hypothetical protein
MGIDCWGTLAEPRACLILLFVDVDVAFTIFSV